MLCSHHTTSVRRVGTLDLQLLLLLHTVLPALAAAICELLFTLDLRHASSATNSHLLRTPITDELSDEGAEEDHDDDVAVEVHGQQHDDVCDAESGHVNDRSNQLLHECWSESEVGWSRAASSVQAVLFLMA